MAHISDPDRTVFQKAYLTVQDNFTTEQLTAIHRLATELDAILKSALNEQKARIDKAH